MLVLWIVGTTANYGPSPFCYLALKPHEWTVIIGKAVLTCEYLKENR